MQSHPVRYKNPFKGFREYKCPGKLDTSHFLWGPSLGLISQISQLSVRDRASKGQKGVLRDPSQHDTPSKQLGLWVTGLVGKLIPKQ